VKVRRADLLRRPGRPAGRSPGRPSPSRTLEITPRSRPGAGSPRGGSTMREQRCPATVVRDAHEAAGRGPGSASACTNEIDGAGVRRATCSPQISPPRSTRRECPLSALPRQVPRRSAPKTARFGCGACGATRPRQRVQPKRVAAQAPRARLVSVGWPLGSRTQPAGGAGLGGGHGRRGLDAVAAGADFDPPVGGVRQAPAEESPRPGGAASQRSALARTRARCARSASPRPGARAVDVLPAAPRSCNEKRRDTYGVPQVAQGRLVTIVSVESIKALPRPPGAGNA
jgi:hypothetical protein